MIFLEPLKQWGCVFESCSGYGCVCSFL